MRQAFRSSNKRADRRIVSRISSSPLICAACDRLSVRKTPRYSSTCAAPAKHAARAAAPPGPARSCCRYPSAAAIVCPARRAADRVHRRSRARPLRCDRRDRRRARPKSAQPPRAAAGRVGPRHEMIAAEAGLAHHVLEGDVGGTRHRRHQRTAGGAVGVARSASSSTPRLARSIISCLVAVVEHGKARRHVGLEGKLLQQPRAAARGWSAPSARPASPARQRTAFAPTCAGAHRDARCRLRGSRRPARRRRASPNGRAS